MADNEHQLWQLQNFIHHVSFYPWPFLFAFPFAGSYLNVHLIASCGGYFPLLHLVLHKENFESSQRDWRPKLECVFVRKPGRLSALPVCLLACLQAA